MSHFAVCFALTLFLILFDARCLNRRLNLANFSVFTLFKLFSHYLGVLMEFSDHILLEVKLNVLFGLFFNRSGFSGLCGFVL